MWVSLADKRLGNREKKGSSMLEVEVDFASGMKKLIGVIPATELSNIPSTLQSMEEGRFCCDCFNSALSGAVKTWRLSQKTAQANLLFKTYNLQYAARTQ